jgi:hypothetical protein
MTTTDLAFNSRRGAPRSWRRALGLLTVVPSLYLLEACATTRVVKTQPGHGGEIMVQEGLFGDARADARKKMKGNCGGKKPVITEEGETVVGKHSRSSTDKMSWGSTTSGDEEDKREWRLKYKCI